MNTTAEIFFFYNLGRRSRRCGRTARDLHTEWVRSGRERTRERERERERERIGKFNFLRTARRVSFDRQYWNEKTLSFDEIYVLQS